MGDKLFSINGLREVRPGAPRNGSAGGTRPPPCNQSAADACGPAKMLQRPPQGLLLGATKDEQRRTLPTVRLDFTPIKRILDSGGVPASPAGKRDQTTASHQQAR